MCGMWSGRFVGGGGVRKWSYEGRRYQCAPPFIQQVVPVAENCLPVQLPTVVQFNGRSPSPLTQSEEWQRSSCGKYECVSVSLLTHFKALLSINCACMLWFELHLYSSNKPLTHTHTHTHLIACASSYANKKWINLEVLHRICTQYYKHMIKIQRFVFLVVCWLQTQVKCQQ